jgi:cellulose synthase/poly-beta-1,6-N-acetylglucosamine synthase-like glycosyltransferase
MNKMRPLWLHPKGPDSMFDRNKDIGKVDIIGFLHHLLFILIVSSITVTHHSIIGILSAFLLVIYIIWFILQGFVLVIKELKTVFNEIDEVIETFKRLKRKRITITPSVILQAGHTYNYTIVTSSYPQIIHAKSKSKAKETINCTSFADVINEKTYTTDWIPAILLE